MTSTVRTSSSRLDMLVPGGEKLAPVWSVEVIETEQRERLAVLRAGRDSARVSGLRSRLAAAAQTDENLMPLFIEAVENDVTLGEICSTLREAWGEYRPGNWV
jgi:methylmalonyl-CoA mutase N-terminal domain/subunit